MLVARLRYLLGAVSTLFLLGLASPAWADAALKELDASPSSTEGASDSGDTPWSRGVSAEEREAAEKPFLEGNAYLKDSLFKLAVGKYEEALTHWDHPGIHFNLALALMSLDDPVQVYEHLQKSVAYGEGPLDADKLERAQSYITLLEQQLSRVIVTCDEPGAEVRMDGKVLFTAPGKHEAWVRVGEHTWSAFKPGFERTQKSEVLTPKATATIELNLYRPEELTSTKRRFATWVPIVPIVAGGVLVAGGVTFNLLARNDMAKFDSGLTDQCGLSSSNRSCPPNSDLTSKKDRAEAFQAVSIASLIAGGTAIAAGVVLFSMNRPTRYQMTPEERDARPLRETAIVPWVSPEGGGFVASGRF
jgi:hypothetical protein